MFGNNSGGDCVEQLKAWWAGAPLYTRFLTYATGSLQIISFLTPIAYYLFANAPILSFGSFQVWRLFTSPFVSDSIITFLFSWLIYLPIITREEKEKGTVKAIVEFFIIAFEINILFNIVCYAFSVLYTPFLGLASYGLWSFFFVNVVKRATQDPDGLSQIFCLPIQIKNRYLPIALLLFVCLLSQSIRFDLLSAVGVGYLQQLYLENFWSRFLTQSRYQSWENSCAFSWMKAYPSFVPFGGNAPTQSQSRGYQAQPYREPQRPQPPPTNAFAGRGVAIGGADIEAPPPKNERYAQLDDTNDEDAARQDT